MQKGRLKKNPKPYTGTVATPYANKISTHQKAGFALAESIEYYKQHTPPEIFLCIDILCTAVYHIDLNLERK